MLVEPCLRHEVRRVFFVLYTHDAAAARKCARSLAREFTRAGIEVVDVLRSDGARWFPVTQSGGGPEGPGVPYDVDAHLFTAQSVMRGSGDPALAHRAGADRCRRRRAGGRGGGGCRGGRRPTVRRSRPGGRDPVAGRGAAGLRSSRVGGRGGPRAAGDPRPPGRATRCCAMSGARRPSAGCLSGRPWWRRRRRDLVAAPASVLAFLAWLAGHGALAWCALDRAAEGDPPCSLAGLRGRRRSSRRSPPSVWEEGW